MNETSEDNQPNKHLKTIGWVLTIVGGAMYVYGFFVDGGASFVEWALYMPDWAVQFVPNWQAEIGFMLSVIGSIPLYYVEIKNLRAA